MKRQAEIPGTQRPNSIPELDAAAEKFKAASKRRKKAQDDEIACRDFVGQLMKKHGLDAYEDLDANLIVTIATSEKVVVDEMIEKPGDDEVNELPVEAHRKLEPKAAKKATPEA